MFDLSHKVLVRELDNPQSLLNFCQRRTDIRTAYLEISSLLIMGFLVVQGIVGFPALWLILHVSAIIWKKNSSK